MSHTEFDCRRINLGCGATPTVGWTNYDNSITVRLAKYPGAVRVLERIGLLSADQAAFAHVAQEMRVEWANAAKRIPVAEGSIDVVYSSHMLEHLDRGEARLFLAEVLRVLIPGGIIRLAVPDLALLVRLYERDGDANLLIQRSQLARSRPRKVRDQLRWMVTGDRRHFWMYDASSLTELLTAAGFKDPKVMAPGETSIPNPGLLDLRERQDESLYVEAFKP